MLVISIFRLIHMRIQPMYECAKCHAYIETILQFFMLNEVFRSFRTRKYTIYPLHSVSFEAANTHGRKPQAHTHIPFGGESVFIQMLAMYSKDGHSYIGKHTNTIATIVMLCVYCIIYIIHLHISMYSCSWVFVCG